jgi:hypothetical protein
LAALCGVELVASLHSNEGTPCNDAKYHDGYSGDLAHLTSLENIRGMARRGEAQVQTNGLLGVAISAFFAVLMVCLARTWLQPEISPVQVATPNTRSRLREEMRLSTITSGRAMRANQKKNLMPEWPMEAGLDPNRALINSSLARRNGQKYVNVKRSRLPMRMKPVGKSDLDSCLTTIETAVRLMTKTTTAVLLVARQWFVRYMSNVFFVAIKVGTSVG